MNQRLMIKIVHKNLKGQLDQEICPKHFWAQNLKGPFDHEICHKHFPPPRLKSRRVYANVQAVNLTKLENHWEFPMVAAFAADPGT